MKKIFFLGLLLVAALVSTAQQRKAYCLTDRVNVRESASTQGEIITKLAGGTIVSLDTETKVINTIEGVTAPWWLVTYTENGETKEGFVWGGLLAEQRLYSKRVKELSFLFRKQGAKKWRVAALQTSKVLHTLDIETDICQLSRIRAGRLGAKKQEAIVIEGTCGSQIIQELLVWDGKEMQRAAVARSVGERGEVRHSEQFLVEGDKNGQTGVITFQTDDMSEWDGKKYKNIVTNFRTFEWVEGSLMEIKENN